MYTRIKMMKRISKPFTGYKTALSMVIAMASIGSQAFADDNNDNMVTLIEMGDLHGTLVSHQAVLKHADGTEYNVEASGGLAKLKTVVNGIRTDNPDAVLLSVGDLTHGSAEAMFTVGDAMMIPINAFGIDVYTPGNWDYGYGAAVFRNRFASKPPFPPLPENITTMSAYVSCNNVPEIAGLTDGDYACAEGGSPGAGVIKASFPVVSANLYNDTTGLPMPAAFHNQRVLEPYRILDRNGTRIAVIGLTAAIVPQQADTFNIGLRFRQGVEELPGLIAEVKAAGAQLIVVQSELGLSQNIRLAQSFKDIDVMYSAHTHEVTLGALIVNGDEVTETTPGKPLSYGEKKQLAKGAAVVVETNRDMYVGRLDLQMSGGDIVDFDWEAIPVDDDVDPDGPMAELVAAMEDPFVDTDGDGPDGVERHTFMPGGFVNPSVRGLQLTEDLETVVGHTDTLLLRHHVLEDTLNNFIADGIFTVTNSVADVYTQPGWGNGVDISMANGFRFGNAVLPEHDITLRDLYTWFPISPAVNIADFSGQSIKKSLDTILDAVFNRNVFLQRGGWYVGLANMEQTVDLKNRPFSSSSGRTVSMSVGGQPLDLSKRYVFASCYGHGNPMDEVCRTSGGANFMFFQLADSDNYNSDITLAYPLATENIIVGSTVKQVAPDNFLHPVHALRRYLDSLPGRTVTEAQFGAGQGRVELVDSDVAGNPESTISDQIGQPDNTPDPGFVQPPFGAGPAFFSGVIRQGDNTGKGH
jgi:2',3'-cyclic-nucleotide 2'-phosphodiesterase (5'-nucleotidase family)